MDGLIRKSILSGIMVGVGVVINTRSDNKYIGAMLFSLALLVIIQNQLQLYTGKIGFATWEKIPTLLYMLFFNVIGIAMVFAGVIYPNPELRNSVYEISVIKFDKNFLALLIMGFMCGALMLIAVYSKNMVITVFCIMTFILSGYEHCVADVPYLLLNFSVSNLLKFIVIVLGNSAGSIITYKLIKDEEKA